MEWLLVYGFLNSMNLMVLALGFSMAFGIAGIANFAHGALYVLSGFLVVSLIRTLSMPYYLAMPILVIAMGVIGAFLYWLVLQRIRGAVLSELVGTFGLGVVILESLRGAGFVGFYNMQSFIKGGIEIFGVNVDYQRLIISLTGLGLLFFLWLFSHHTRLGLGFRALSQNEETALCCGMNPELIAMFSVAFSTVLASIAAFVILPLGSLTIDVGYEVLIIAVAVGIVGGLGSNAGIMVGSLILGYAQQFVTMYIGTHWMMVVIFAAIFIILVIRPSGLFGKFKELEERV